MCLARRVIAANLVHPFAAGGLAAIFGRRAIMIVAILLFALGSALTGAAQSMAMVIGGRSVQGVGGGAILTMVEVIVCDLVPLAERGNYFGIIGAVWALVSRLPVPAGHRGLRLTSRARAPTGLDARPSHRRRSRFCRCMEVAVLLCVTSLERSESALGCSRAARGVAHLALDAAVNLPLSGIALVLTIFFMKIKSPKLTMEEKLEKMDY